MIVVIIFVGLLVLKTKTTVKLFYKIELVKTHSLVKRTPAMLFNWSKNTKKHTPHTNTKTFPTTKKPLKS